MYLPIPWYRYRPTNIYHDICFVNLERTHTYQYLQHCTEYPQEVPLQIGCVLPCSMADYSSLQIHWQSLPLPVTDTVSVTVTAQWDHKCLNWQSQYVTTSGSASDHLKLNICSTLWFDILWVIGGIPDDLPSLKYHLLHKIWYDDGD